LESDLEPGSLTTPDISLMGCSSTSFAGAAAAAAADATADARRPDCVRSEQAAAAGRRDGRAELVRWRRDRAGAARSGDRVAAADLVAMAAVADARGGGGLVASGLAAERLVAWTPRWRQK
jgi:hypothetical protein